MAILFLILSVCAGERPVAESDEAPVKVCYFVQKSRSTKGGSLKEGMAPQR